MLSRLMNGATPRLVALALCAVPCGISAGPIPEELPAPKWTEFVQAEGQAMPIPKGWLATEEGRFAHGIKLPADVPTTVPFDFGAARWKALKPSQPSVARQYWEHLCATEAGSFVLKPAERVEGFLFMRPVGGATEQQNNDRWKLEAPGLQASWGFKYNPKREAIKFVDPPWGTYEWVDFADSSGRGVLHMSGYVSLISPMKIEIQSDSAAQFGLIWRGIRRERDREYAISGAEWIAWNRQTREVLGVLRDFYLTGMTTNRRDGIYWLNAARCPFKKAMFGSAGVDGEARVWAPMVIRPTNYPKTLQILDERHRGGAK